MDHSYLPSLSRSLDQLRCSRLSLLGIFLKSILQFRNVTLTVCIWQQLSQMPAILERLVRPLT